MVRIIKATYSNILLASSLALLSIRAGADDQPRPSIPFYDWGACPFECCTHRDWTAIEDVTLYERRSRESREVGRMRRGETARAMTGVVITTELGETRVLRSIEIGYRKNSTKPELSLKPGESVYTLHSKGAAYDVFLVSWRGFVGPDSGSRRWFWNPSVRGDCESHHSPENGMVGAS